MQSGRSDFMRQSTLSDGCQGAGRLAADILDACLTQQAYYSASIWACAAACEMSQF